FLSTLAWPLPSPVTGISLTWQGGQADNSRVVRLNTDVSTAFSNKVSVPCSGTSLPFSPTISRRLVPGASPVLATNTPVAPLAYSKKAVTSSSTSIGSYFPRLRWAVTRTGSPTNHCNRSRGCGHWLMSSPPPSPFHVARQELD